MKHFLASIIFLVLALTSKPQDYIPFPLENTTWVNGYYECNEFYLDCFYFSFSEFNTSGDTLINGFTMTKIMADEPYSWPGPETPPSNYVGALREVAGKVYVVPWNLEEEKLLFDFTVEVGDTVLVYSPVYETEFDISSVTYVEFNGITRKVIQLGGGQWIEGIGSDIGIFKSLGGNLSGFIDRQECVRINGEVVFDHEYGEYDCSSLFTKNEEQLISIYPNPNNGKFKIEGLSGDATVELLDYAGRQIGESQFLSENGEVDFKNDLPVKGIYFARITHGDSVRMERVVID